jgi:three-Cys-motif partner protein
MSIGRSFGGIWTIEKLQILSDYLNFYTKALKNKPFKKIYIDAFAGTGHIHGDLQIKGSASLALETVIPFDQYIFIEKNRSYADELQKLKSKYFELSDRILIINDDCNIALNKICEEINWYKNRAVLFLDPFATQVNWETLRIVSQTKSIDVWYLFPFSAVNRMLKRNGKFPLSWRTKLNALLGDDDWFSQFYKQNEQISFFDDGDIDKYYKAVNTDSLKQYICTRLHTIFPVVASNPRILYNKNHSPLFLFCFAISNENPSAKTLALKGANYILSQKVSE